MQEPIARLVEAAQTLAEPGDAGSLRGAFAQVLAEVEAEARRGAAWADGVDVLGAAYERLLPGEERRSAGQFFTPPWAAELMAAWLLSEPTRLLLDPGCGSGALLMAAARDPRRRGARLLGIERDPLALRMARMNCALRGIEHCELRPADFLLDPLSERPDAVICNPPYSRHHEIPPAEKAAIHEGFQRRLGLRLSRLAALHVLFLVRAVEVCEEGGRLAFITPSDWLDVRYGEAVKRFLLGHVSVDAVVLLDPDHLLFDGVLTTVAIWLMRKDRRPQARTKVVRLGHTLPPPGAVLASLAGRGTLGVEEVSLAGRGKWSRPMLTDEGGVRLGDVARIRRGIATGCNRFFVLSEARRRELGIPREQLRACIASPRLVEGSELRPADLEALADDVPRWAIDCRDPGEEARDSPLGAYLRWGKQVLKAHAGYLARRRFPWYALEQRGDCPILFTYFNRARPRFLRNQAGAVPLNTWLIVEPAPGVDPDELFAALTRPGVTAQLERGARVYGGGLWKLEPSELAEVRLPLDVPCQFRLDVEVALRDRGR